MNDCIKLKCIMLIDDDRATNYINERILAKIGCAENIIVFDNAEEALIFLTKKTDKNHIQPDLIFLDINMPRMDGWEFVSNFTNDLKLSLLNIPIIILTSSFNPSDIEKVNEITEVKELINKPLKKEKVLNILEKYF